MADSIAPLAIRLRAEKIYSELSEDKNLTFWGKGDVINFLADLFNGEVEAAPSNLRQGDILVAKKVSKSDPQGQFSFI